MKRFILVAVAFACLTVDLFCLEVAENELDKGRDARVEFVAYTGPYERIDTLEAIFGIGRQLGSQIDGGAEAAEYADKYRLLRVVDACASPVVLLPGDQDVLPAARRAAQLAAVPARVVPTDMVAGLLALEAVGPGVNGDADSEAAQLQRASHRIHTARIQRAVRESPEEVLAPPLEAQHFPTGDLPGEAGRHRPAQSRLADDQVAHHAALDGRRQRTARHLHFRQFWHQAAG